MSIEVNVLLEVLHGSLECVKRGIRPIVEDEEEKQAFFRVTSWTELPNRFSAWVGFMLACLPSL